MKPRDELLSAWVRGEADIAPVATLLGVRPLSVSRGAASVEMRVGEQHHNAFGTVHGGIFTDLADVAMGAALSAELGPEQAFVTVDIHTRYFRSVRSGWLVASAKVVRRGKSSAYLECDIMEGNELAAKATSTCLFKPMSREQQQTINLRRPKGRMRPGR